MADALELESSGKAKSGTQFKIIPGHHGGYISQMRKLRCCYAWTCDSNVTMYTVVDPGGRFLVSASSNRGWHGESTKTVFVHDVKRAR